MLTTPIGFSGLSGKATILQNGRTLRTGTLTDTRKENNPLLSSLKSLNLNMRAQEDVYASQLSLGDIISVPGLRGHYLITQTKNNVADEVIGHKLSANETPITGEVTLRGELDIEIKSIKN